MQTFMPSTQAQSERRKKLRKKPLRLIYVELAFGNGGMMRDLSEEGFAVRAMMPVKQGASTTFSFLLGDTTRIEGEGKILWIDEGGRVAGVHFTQIAQEMRSQIDDWLIEDEKLTDPREIAKEPRIAPASTIEELRDEIRATPVRGEPAAPPVTEVPVSPKPPIEELPPIPINAANPSAAKVDEPLAANSDVKIAARDALKTGAVSSVEPKPAPAKIASETDTQVTSVTEGFFTKWRKEPVPSAPVVEARAPELPALPLPSAIPVAVPQPQDQSVDEDEQAEEQAESRLPRPDISEILIQPHGLSANTDAQARPLPELPMESRAQRAPWEWITLGRALAMMVVLTLLVSSFVYHRALGSGLIWVGEAMGGTSNNLAAGPSPNPADSVSGTSTGNVDTSETQPPTQPLNPTRTATIPSVGNGGGTSSLGSSGKRPTAPVTPLATPEAGLDSGQSEYLQALQLMRGKNSASDTPEALRLLWIAVEKGNPGAEVSLADLYWHGNGVARNCDQARILFTAAARKGSSEAQARLRQFQQAGCE